MHFSESPVTTELVMWCWRPGKFGTLRKCSAKRRIFARPSQRSGSSKTSSITTGSGVKQATSASTSPVSSAQAYAASRSLMAMRSSVVSAGIFSGADRSSRSAAFLVKRPHLEKFSVEDQERESDGQQRRGQPDFEVVAGRSRIYLSAYDGRECFIDSRQYHAHGCRSERVQQALERLLQFSEEPAVHHVEDDDGAEDEGNRHTDHERDDVHLHHVNAEPENQPAD